MEKASSRISTEHSSLLRRSCLNSPSLKLVISGTFSFSVSLKPHETHTDAHAHTRTRTLKKEKQSVTELNGSSGSQATEKQQRHINHAGSGLPGRSLAWIHPLPRQGKGTRLSQKRRHPLHCEVGMLTIGLAVNHFKL